MADEVCCPDALPRCAGSRHDFTNGPSGLPKAQRVVGRTMIELTDPTAELILRAGFATEPRDSCGGCGGPERLQLEAFQFVGAHEDVAHELAVASGLILAVHHARTFTSICTSLPFANGTGRAMYTGQRRGCERHARQRVQL